MEGLKLIFMIFATITMISSITTVHSSLDLTNSIAWIPTRSTTSANTCNGTVAECLSYEDEFELDTEINRRILASSQYISYGALQKNRVPCSRRGASYYNCQPGAQANPYSRGCSAITRCRS